MKPRSTIQWSLFIASALGYELWLVVAHYPEHASVGAAVFGMWCGATFAVPGADGKRNWTLLWLSLPLTLAAANIGACFWNSIFGWGPGDVVFWTIFTLIGWIAGLAAAATQRSWKGTVVFGLALLLAALEVIPCLPIGLHALGFKPEFYSRYLSLYLLSFGLVLLVAVVLLACAGFRRPPRPRRAWIILGCAVLLSMLTWGVAEARYRLELRQLRSRFLNHPAPTPEERHTRELFDRAAAAGQSYFALAVKHAGYLLYPSPPYWEFVFQWYHSGPAKEQAAILDSTAEADALYRAIEEMLQQESLPLTPDDETIRPLSFHPPSAIRMMTEWLAFRVYLRHTTSDNDGVIRYLEQMVRLTELWRGDRSQLSQSIHYQMDASTLKAIRKFGPDGPEYAGYYRDWLRRLGMRRYEQLLQLQYLEPGGKNMIWMYMRCGAGTPPWKHWYMDPLDVRELTEKFRRSLEAQQQFPDLRRKAADGIPQQKDWTRHDYDAALGFIAEEAYLQTALALKLYRSLHGEYPESLDQLVPEILPRLPNLPATGKPPTYSKIENYFELDAASHRQVLRPVADY